MKFPKLRFLSLVAGLTITGVLPVQGQTANPIGGAGTRSVALLLCQYADKPNTYGLTPAGILPTWIGGTTQVNGVTVDNSINGLVQDASLGSINLNGTQAFGWYTLPGPQASYPSGSDAGNACIAAAQQNTVNLQPFTYVAVYMNDTLNDAMGISWTTTWANGKTSPTTWNALAVGVRGFTSAPLLLHELGHILGNVNRHTSSASDPLGGGAGLGDNPATPPAFGIRIASVGPEWDASTREQMGFIAAGGVVTTSGGTQTYNLSRLTQPIAGLPVAIDVPLPGGAKYVVSARTRISYDSYPFFSNFAFPTKTLQTDGVRIELFTSPTTDVNLQMSNPNGDPSSAAGVWLAGQTFSDTANGVTISVGNFNAAGNPTATITVTSNGAQSTAPVFAVDAGGPAAGNFVADTAFTGGTAYTTANNIDISGVTNPAPQAVYQSNRYGNFSYTIPNLNPGATYNVRLHFAEIFWNAPGQRVFNVSVNGTQLLTNFDIFAAAGAPNKAVIQQFGVVANASGQIVIQFVSLIDNAAVSGIEVTQ